MNAQSLVRLLSGPVNRIVQLACDGRGKLGEANRQRSQQTKAAGQHHVAVWDGEMRSKARAVEQAAARSAERNRWGWLCDRAELQRAMTHVIEHGLVRQRAGGERVQVPFQLLPGELAGVVLEEAGNPPPLKERGDRMKVAKVDDHRAVELPDSWVVEGAQDGRRTGVHQEERLRPGPGPGDRAHARHSRWDLGGEKAETREPGAALNLFAQIVETKAPVTDPRWCRAMVEHRHRHRIERAADMKAV